VCESFLCSSPNCARFSATNKTEIRTNSEREGQSSFTHNIKSHLGKLERRGALNTPQERISDNSKIFSERNKEVKSKMKNSKA
jgi:hypothetical protein